MTVIAACLYSDGRRVADININDPLPKPQGKDDFYWIGLAEPSAQELAAVETDFGLHPLAIEDAGKAHQMPKLDIYGDQLFVVARTVSLHEGELAYGETALFVGKHHLVSARHGSARAHRDLRAQLESSPTVLRHGVDYVLHAILDYIVDGYLPVVEDLEDVAANMENRALDGTLGRDDIRRLFTLRRTLGRFQRTLEQTSDLCAKLANLDLPTIDANVRPYFRDVQDHVRRVEHRVAALRETLTAVFEMSMLIEQQQQGDITRQLAAWAAILAVPTAIAGIYGMNFENMPELSTRYGYFVIMAVIIGTSSFLFFRFRRLGWL